MSNTLKLVLLMLVTFVILGVYAFMTYRPSIFGWEPKTIPLSGFVNDTTKLALNQDDEKASKDTVKTPATKQRILLFGDSMTGLLCYPLSQYAVANGHTLDCMTWTSATTRMWDESNKLDSLMKAVKPTYVMVCLGSNELYSHDMENIGKHVHSILDRIGNVPVLWIGPPNWSEDGGINDLLLSIMGKGSFYPSKDLTLERRGDGRHPTKKAAELWMDKVVEWINGGNATYPILMKAPKIKKCDLNLTVVSPQGKTMSLQQRELENVDKDNKTTGKEQTKK